MQIARTAIDDRQLQAAVQGCYREQLFGHWLLWLAALKAKRRQNLF
jgi:hypothetical protein